MITFWP